MSLAFSRQPSPDHPVPVFTKLTAYGCLILFLKECVLWCSDTVFCSLIESWGWAWSAVGRHLPSTPKALASTSVLHQEMVAGLQWTHPFSSFSAVIIVEETQFGITVCQFALWKQLELCALFF